MNKFSNIFISAGDLALDFLTSCADWRSLTYTDYRLKLEYHREHHEKDLISSQ